MDAQLVVDEIIEDLKSTHMLDWNAEEDDWQSLMQYYITSEFLHQTYDFGWSFIDIVIQKHLDRLSDEDQLNLTKEAFEYDAQAYEKGQDQGLIPEDDDYDQLQTVCEEANFMYVKTLLREQADDASSEYQEELESAG